MALQNKIEPYMWARVKHVGHESFLLYDALHRMGHSSVETDIK